MTEKIKYIIIDLVNFTKTADELETIEDKWLYLLKHALQKGYAAEMLADIMHVSLSQVLEIRQELRNA